MSDVLALPALEPGAHIGVTGSRHGSTPEARQSLKFMIDQLQAVGAVHLHQGCATGWDAASVPLAKKAGLIVEAHPPIDTRYYSVEAFEQSDVLHPPKAFRARDDDIAYASAVILAGPQYPEDDSRSLRSGTWLTIRLARWYGDRVYSCNPDGSITDITEAP